MGRYLGPKHRICRRAGEKLCDLVRCPTQRRPYPPGIHGQMGRKKITDYGAQLLEKQKARHVYGILERQLRTYYQKAIAQEGDTGAFLLQHLEQRLDNVVFRMGFVPSRSAARQAVGHGHITVNGKRVNIASYQVKEGDVIAVHTRSRTSPRFVDTPKVVAQHTAPEWLTIDADGWSGRVLRMPTATDVQLPFRMRRIVEFYSR